MPYLNAPACVLGDCDAPVFPTLVEACVCTPNKAGISELYFVPCTETFSEVNVTDPYWWQGLADPLTGTLGRSGLGLGSIGKKNSKSERFSSCRTEQPTSITWALKFTIKCFDKSSARVTCAMLNEVLNNFNRYMLVARMCSGDETVLPIGLFTTSDIDWVVPDNFEENQSAILELSWNQLSVPCTVDVPGLQAVLPKAA